MTGRAKEAWVGAGVMLIFVLLVGWASGGGKNATRDGYTLTARFEQVDGVAVGTPVRLAGLQIGRVSNVSLDAKALKPILTFTLQHKIRLPVDSAALIMSDGVLGDKFIKIEPGSEDETLAPGEAFEFAQSSIILEHILHRVVVTAEERLRPLKEGSPKKDKPANGEKK